MVYSDHIRLLNPALPERQPLYRYGYAMDPDPVMSCPRLKPAARLVYRAILRLCGRGTVCRASVEQIASQAGVSVRSVQRHVSILTDRDLIETEETPGSETIFRLLPLPAWITEGRKPVLARAEQPGAEGERGEGGTLTPHASCLTPPQGCQPDGGGVTDCQGRGDSLSPPMDNKEHERENPISLSGFGSESGTRWTDQPVASEREGVEENLQPVREETDPTPRQIVHATCQVLGFHPTEAQVSVGVGEVAALHAGGFSLTEIGEGARYAAEQRWVRSFAGVKFYLPQALNALSTRKAQSAERKAEESTPCAVRSALCDVLVSRHEAAEASPHRGLWEQVRQKIATRIQRQSYRTWFDPTCIADFDGQRVVLNVSSHFFSDWLEEHYLELIEATFEEVLGHAVEVSFEVPEGGG